MHSPSDSKAKGIVGPAAFRDVPEYAQAQQWGVFPDPRNFYRETNSFFEELDQLAQAFNHPLSDEFTAEQRQELLSTIKIEKNREPGEIVFKVVFTIPTLLGNKLRKSVGSISQTAGFNPTVAWQGPVGENGIPGVMTTYRYRLDAGIYVPVSITRLVTHDKSFIHFKDS